MKKKQDNHFPLCIHMSFYNRVHQNGLQIKAYDSIKIIIINHLQGYSDNSFSQNSLPFAPVPSFMTGLQRLNFCLRENVKKLTTKSPQSTSRKYERIIEGTFFYSF